MAVVTDFLLVLVPMLLRTELRTDSSLRIEKWSLICIFIALLGVKLITILDFAILQ